MAQQQVDNRRGGWSTAAEISEHETTQGIRRRDRRLYSTCTRIGVASMRQQESIATCSCFLTVS